MRILFATSECAPFSKSGGLADVAFSLPPALKKAGETIEIITPLYQCVWERFRDRIEFVMDETVELSGTEYACELYRGERDGVPVWFVKYDPFFDRPRLYGYDDDKLRFAMFSKAVIQLLPDLGPMPDILHCNDWETALSVIYLKNDQVTNPALKKIRSVFTIHNIAYQGQFSAWELQTTFALPEGWYNGGLGFEYEGRHDVNLMKGAMMMADAVSTVSPTYARELHHHRYGMGLEGVAHLVDNKLQGILNGIDMDHYDPARDERLPAHFDVKHMKGKAACKESAAGSFRAGKGSPFPPVLPGGAAGGAEGRGADPGAAAPADGPGLPGDHLRPGGSRLHRSLQLVQDPVAGPVRVLQRLYGGHGRPGFRRIGFLPDALPV